MENKHNKVESQHDEDALYQNGRFEIGINGSI